MVGTLLALAVLLVAIQPCEADAEAPPPADLASTGFQTTSSAEVQPTEALRQYEAVLATAPNRLHALAGAARSAAAIGDESRARQLYSQIMAQCDPRSGWREREEAKAYIAGE